MNYLPVKKRVDIGKNLEDKVRNWLNDTCVGYHLIESTHNEDCNEKTDCWQVAKSGKLHRVAIKVRLNQCGLLENEKTDILVCLAEPFYGVGHPENKVGRDMQYGYSMYISAIRGCVRVAKGDVVHKLVKETYQEALLDDKFNKYKPRYRGTGCKKMFYSDATKCSIWLNYDAETGIPKLLVFIPPEILVLNKEIKIHNNFNLE